jgi:hypothetical protein
MRSGYRSDRASERGAPSSLGLGEALVHGIQKASPAVMFRNIRDSADQIAPSLTVAVGSARRGVRAHRDRFRPEVGENVGVR